MKYAAFKGSTYYPQGGGAKDFIGFYDSENEAKLAIGQLDHYQWGQIAEVRLSGMKIIYDFEVSENLQPDVKLCAACRKPRVNLQLVDDECVDCRH